MKERLKLCLCYCEELVERGEASVSFTNKFRNPLAHEHRIEVSSSHQKHLFDGRPVS